MKPKHLLSLSVLLISAACSQPEQKPLTQYVDMYIGTGGHGHVFMGANVPFGAVQLGPTSIPQSWDWVSGYHISDSFDLDRIHHGPDDLREPAAKMAAIPARYIFLLTLCEKFSSGLFGKIRPPPPQARTSYLHERGRCPFGAMASSWSA